MLISGQCRAARALIKWTQTELAQAANVSLSTVSEFEGESRNPIRRNKVAIQQALEAAGIEFIAENGGGAGVRLRKNPVIAY